MGGELTMYDFPASPAENDEYTPPVGGQTYIFKNPRWLVKGIPPVGGGGSGGGIEEAPTDGNQYAREDAAWTVLDIPAGDWASITGKPATFPPTLPIPWTDVSGKPATYPPTLPIDWINVSNKPATFPPSTHSHAQSDVTNLVTDLAAKAPLASPSFTGTPLAPTPTTADNTTKLATTAYVKAQGYLTGAPTDGNTYGRQSGAWVAVVDQVTYTTDMTDLNDGMAAQAGQIADLTGRVSTIESAGYVLEAPNDGQQYARQDLDWFPIDAVVDWADLTGKPATFPPSLPIAQSGVTNLVTDLAAKAPLASPALTGTPTAPTATAGTNTTQLATTAFVAAALTGGVSTAQISDSAPASPTHGMLWWDSTFGGFFIYYNDGTSSQWVQINGVAT